MENLSITDIKLLQSHISITWNNGHTSIFSSRKIRLNCKCAQCVDEITQENLIDETTSSEILYAEDHLIVGNYARKFLWSDGHSTGIYPFDTLVKLCQCQICNNQ